MHLQIEMLSHSPLEKVRRTLVVTFILSYPAKKISRIG